MDNVASGLLFYFPLRVLIPLRAGWSYGALKAGVV